MKCSQDLAAFVREQHGRQNGQHLQPCKRNFAMATDNTPQGNRILMHKV